MSKNNHSGRSGQDISLPQEKKNIFTRNPFLTMLFFYVVAIIIVFGPVLLKPMDTPDTISQLYPAYVFNKAYFLHHFKLPFWMPDLAGGTPWVEGANFNHLFDFICFLFPLQLGIGYRVILFVLMAGIFAYLFFRSLKFDFNVSLLAGLAYMLSGDAVSYAMIGHFGKTVNMTFLPLVLMFINYGFAKRNPVYFLFAGLPMAFLFKGHPQVFYYNIGIITVYFAFKTVLEALDSRKVHDKPQALSEPSPSETAHVQAQPPVSGTPKSGALPVLGLAVLGFFIMGVVAVVLSSDNLYNQLLMLKMSSRGAVVDALQKWQFATSWSLHPLELLGYFLPSVFGLQNQTYMGWRPFVSTTDYVGLVVIFVALFGVIANWKSRYVKFFAGITFLAVLYGFGSFFTPYFRLFYDHLPMIKSFRVPSTIYIVVAFFLVYFFAYGLRSLFSTDWTEPVNRKKADFFMLCILGLALLLTWYVNSSGYMENLKSALGTKVDLNAYYAKYPASQVDGFVAQNTKPAKDMALAGLKGLWVFSLLFVFFFFLFSRKKMKQGVFVFLMVVMVFIDLAMVDRNFIRSVDNYDFITQNTPDLQFIKQDKGQFRIIPFPPQNDNEANKWPAHNLESAYAYNAAAIKLFDDIQNAGFLLDIRFLGLFNVKYLISAQNYQAPQIEKVYQGAKNVYLNRMFLPRLFFVDKAKVIPAQPDILAYMRSPRFEPGKEIILEEDQDTAGMKAAGNTLETVSYEPDRMEFKVKMENPSFLFLSEVFFPKWECFVDGKRTKIYRTDYLFRSIKLEKGDHVVVFKYGDNGRYAIQTLGILLLTVLLIIFIIRNRKKYF